MSMKYNSIIRSLKYIKHIFTARNTKGFGVHSPYLFDFVRNVLMEKKPYYAFEEIEIYRKHLRKNKEKIQVEDFGSGRSRVTNISNIVSTAVKPRKQAQLLYRIINQYKFKNILELGTSVGLSTLYLSAVSSESKCYTMEGSKNIASIANLNFDHFNRKNIELIVGNIDNNLPDVLDKGPFDFVFMDANHKFEPMVNYFEQITTHLVKDAIIVIDDINHSTEMEQFWKFAVKHQKVTASMDIFHMGILFTKKELNQKKYKLAF